MLLLVFLGCANNIQTLYEQEKAAVLAAPAALGASWDPELRVRLSDPALEVLSQAALESGLLKAEDKIRWEGPLGVEAELSPKLEVKSLELRASKECDACLDLSASLTGTGNWKVGSLKGEVPLSLDIGGVVAFEVKKVDSSFQVTGKLKNVSQVKIKTTTVGDLDIAKPIQSWGKELSDHVPPFDLGEFGGDEVPLRALRLATVGGALAVEAVTDVAGGGPLTGPAPALKDGWELAISQKTALALMRRAAFEEGVIDYDVAADPRYLDVNGTMFTMGVRLWRLTSRGWWRDYEVTGNIDILPRSVRLVPKQAREGDKSEGAGVADPLALLAEGKILEVVEEGLEQTLPSGQSTDIGGQSLELRASSVKGMGGALVMSGSMKLGDGKDDEPSGGSGSSEKKGGKKPNRERKPRGDH